MLEHKGIPFKRVDLVTAMHRPSLKLLGFRGQDRSGDEGGRAQGPGHARDLAALDEMKPEPPLVPSDAVREAERWGDEELQSIPRRLAWWALVHLSGKERTEAARLSLRGLPRGAADRHRRRAPCSRSRRSRPATTTRPTRTVKADLAAVPGQDRPGRRAPRRGRDRRRAAERRRLPDRDERAAAARLRGPASPTSRAARPPTTRAASCPSTTRAFPPVFPAEWLPSSSYARRLELSPHQRVPAARGQHLPHARAARAPRP